MGGIFIYLAPQFLMTLRLGTPIQMHLLLLAAVGVEAKTRLGHQVITGGLEEVVQ